MEFNFFQIESFLMFLNSNFYNFFLLSFLYSLVRFVPMNVDDEESIQDLLYQIDNVIQYGEDADVKIHDFDPPEEEEQDNGNIIFE